MLGRLFKNPEGRCLPGKTAARDTIIRYRIPDKCHVVLRIYDPSGEEIQELVNGRQSAGEHKVAWDGKTWQGRFVPSGIYYYRVFSGNSAFTGKIIRDSVHDV